MKKLTIVAFSIVCAIAAFALFDAFNDPVLPSNAAWSYFKAHPRLCSQRTVEEFVSPDRKRAIIAKNVSCLASFDETVVYLYEKETNRRETFGEYGGRVGVSTTWTSPVAAEVCFNPTGRQVASNLHLWRTSVLGVSIADCPFGWDPITF